MGNSNKTLENITNHLLLFFRVNRKKTEQRVMSSKKTM